MGMFITLTDGYYLLDVQGEAAIRPNKDSLI